MTSIKRAGDRKVNGDAEAVMQSYGDYAPVYARVRAHAARTRGAPDDAKHWKDIEETLEADGRQPPGGTGLSG